MGDKKGKALALELIDDLLNEKSDVQIAKDEPQKKKPEMQGTVVKPSSVQPSAQVAVRSAAKQVIAEAENDKTIDMSTGEPMPMPSPNLPARIPGNDEDRTVPIEQNRSAQTVVPPGPKTESAHEVRASVGRPGAFRSLGAPTATEAALAQSESLRIAQSRILELENEIERLRLQNEELGAAGETLRRRADELLSENTKREHDYQFAVSTFEQEKSILSGTKEALQREVEIQKRKNEELELRISTNIQKIRVRERELENRLELVKMESAALIRAKDEMILDLKRQIDQLNLELNNYRTKNQELNRLATDKQEMLRRTVKALRLALSMLEGEEEAPKTAQRKAK
jgi:hypothetical protein